MKDSKNSLTDILELETKRLDIKLDKNHKQLQTGPQRGPDPGQVLKNDARDPPKTLFSEHF